MAAKKKKNTREKTATMEMETQASMAERQAPEGARDEDPGRTDADSGEADVESAESALDGMRRERDQYLALLQRKTAEFSNYQKRAAQDRQAWIQDAVGALCEDLIPVLDDMARALELGRQEVSEETRAVLDGVEISRRSLMSALARHGLEQIVAEDRDFDPMMDQALSQIPHDDIPAGGIVTVVRTGYRLGSRILRPCEVLVSSGPAQHAARDDNADQEDADQEEKKEGQE